MEIVRFFNSQTLSNPIQYYGFDTEKSEPQLAHYNTEGIPARIATTSSSTSSIPMPTWEIISVSTVVSPAPSDLCRIGSPLFNPALFQLPIQGQDYHINIGGLYNIYNALAAVSVAGFFGVQPEVITRI